MLEQKSLNFQKDLINKYSSNFFDNKNKPFLRYLRCHFRDSSDFFKNSINAKINDLKIDNFCCYCGGSFSNKIFDVKMSAKQALLLTKSKLTSKTDFDDCFIKILNRKISKTKKFETDRVDGIVLIKVG